MIDFQKIFTDGVELSFLVEIGARTVIMFLIILVILRLSGRRGIRQLTVFEVAIIISLGSAAGDPMFLCDHCFYMCHLCVQNNHLAYL